MSESYNKLIKTLQTIFEMDKADLDFGIYRIMNQKRDDINKFLEEDLLPQVKQAFADYAHDGQDDLQKELEDAIEQARKLGAPDPENTEAALEIKKKLASAVDATALENDVFSKLHTFFSRYYDKGDFISQRRYKKDTYAIPYEGEEVKLYWANHDQYYIKSSEYLRDYVFIAKDTNDNDKPFRIKLVEADTEKDNTKAKPGEERRFILNEDNPLSIEGDELLIRFNFTTVGKKKQDALNKAAIEFVFKQDDEVFSPWLTILKTLAPTAKNKDRTLIEKHLNDYTARNTFDYFIHKDLGGFLNRELDFYIKNEALYLDDIDDIDFSVTEQQIRKIKTLRNIAKKIIRMLAQLEDFQKKLWLKKKFVVESNYCITLDRIPFDETLFETIFENNAQIEEWVEMYSIDRVKLDTNYDEMEWDNFLKVPEYKYLILDTMFFNQEFKDKLLASIENIDEQCNGLLLNADNFQALNFLRNTYDNRIGCTYIDPPYNTNASEIIYKNGYKHSSWITLMHDRIELGRALSNNTSISYTAIDHAELFNLGRLKDDIYGEENRIAIVSIQHNPKGRNQAKFFSENSEFMLVYANEISVAKFNQVAIDDEVLATFDQEDRNGRFRYENYIRARTSWSRTNRPNNWYPIYISSDLQHITSEFHDDYHEIYPATDQGDFSWKNIRESFDALNNNDYFIAKNEDGKVKIYHQYREQQVLKNFWSQKKYQSEFNGTNLLKDILGGAKFDYPKSIYTVMDSLKIASKKEDIILDYFAGSGTTGQAVIDLNRLDSSNRKYILVEMGEHFEDVLKPRIKKVIYSSTWKRGKPIEIENATSQMFKYIRTETYEDTLNNLNAGNTTNENDLLNENMELKEDYMLGYWLDVETTNSASLLNVEQFEDPFNYKLNVCADSVGETKQTTIDLVETFNYLIGLTVKTIDVIRGFKVMIGTNQKDETVLVVWRNLKEKDNTALDEFLDKQGYNPRDTEFEHIYVNGDHTLEDPQSKVKMTEIEFKRLMFDVKDI